MEIRNRRFVTFLIAFPACAIVFIGGTGFFVLGGCTREGNEQNRWMQIEEGVDNGILEFSKAVDQGMDVQLHERQILQMVQASTNAEFRIRCTRRALRGLLRIDVSNFRRSYSASRSIESIWNKLFGVWKKAGMSESEVWQARLDYTAWFLRQVDLLCQKEREESAKLPDKGPVALSLSNRVWGLRGAIESLTLGFFSHLDYEERHYVEVEAKLPQEVRETMRARFESVLGRPLRTFEQIRQDGRDLYRILKKQRDRSRYEYWIFCTKVFREYLSKAPGEPLKEPTIEAMGIGKGELEEVFVD